VLRRVEGRKGSFSRIVLAADAIGYSAQLYAALHRLDDTGLDRIVVESPPAGDEWLAVHDRLRRAESA
jgi:L-threonylcarbamoyladenylate synthase